MAELGTDISCVEDLDPAFTVVSGVQALSQAQLEEIGRAWTDALCRKARDRAADETRELNRAQRAK